MRAEGSAVERRVRYRGRGGQVGLGLLVGDRVQGLSGSMLGPVEAREERFSLEELTLLAPVQPSKIIGIGTNYRAHAVEMGRGLPRVPKIFLMPSTAVIAPGEGIPLPPGELRIDHEAELGVVIGRRASRVAAAQAAEVIAGFTAVNDVTCRDHQRADGTFSRGKGRDGFCPIGPCLAVGLDPSDLAVRCRVNGELRQDGRTSDLVFDVPTLVAFVSEVMTLLPGDVIATGTPFGVGPLAVGDVVEVEVEGVGVLRNPVVARA